MADSRDGGETNNQNSEVSSTKPELCENNGPSHPVSESQADSRGHTVKFGSTPVLGAAKNHFALRTSILGESTPGRSTPFALNPPRLSNPFAKAEELKLEKGGDKEENNVKDSDESSRQDPAKEGSPLTSKPKVESVSFVPLKSEGGGSGSGSVGGVGRPGGATSSLGFVFGENLHERVEPSLPSFTDKQTTSVVKNESETKTNGTTSEMLFTSGVKRETPSDKATENSHNKSLTEAAREYEEARSVKRKYEAVRVVTGEEEECNVVQMNCKLFGYDSVGSSWVERGRALLRLNDLPQTPHSRLIVRATGSLRLLLNTKIWAGMSIGRASPKSLTLTAMDSSQLVKVFLVMASPKEIDQLERALDWRVTSLKKASLSSSSNALNNSSSSPSSKNSNSSQNNNSTATTPTPTTTITISDDESLSPSKKSKPQS